MSWLLVIILVIPLLGAVLGCLIRARWIGVWAMGVSLLTLLACAALAWQFKMATPDPLVTDPSLRLVFGPQASNSASPLRFGAIGMSCSLGIDAISLCLVLLTAFLTPLAIAASFRSIRQRQKEYYLWMLILLTAMLGVFIARDVLLFYIFFELTLIPMFFIIGVWGGPDRRRAAVKFFLFTFAGSVFTLAAIIFLGLKAGLSHQHPSFAMADVIAYAQGLDPHVRFWVLLGLLAGFAVKVPLFPLHTWLPLAHTEAPTAGSVILAGVLLKLGTYGMLRLAIPIGLVGANLSAKAIEGHLIPGAQLGYFAITLGDVLTFVAILCIIGIIYGALAAWVQQDIKKLVAYSSVSHLGFCVLGLMAFSTLGVQGSVLYMINHGLSTGALFLVVGMIYDRYHTRDINQLSGLARRMPILAFFFVLFALSSIGLPGLNGFVSEFLTILSAFVSIHLGAGFGALAAIGVILGALYMLHMLARVIWGPLKFPVAHGHSPTDQSSSHAANAKDDIGPREISILIPLALVVVLLGVWPRPLLRALNAPAEALLAPIPESKAPPQTSEETESIPKHDPLRMFPRMPRFRFP